MDTYLALEYGHREELPDEYVNEVRTPDALVAHFVKAFTDPGDRVIDIFAGYGTTLTVAEHLDRVPFGIEYEADRVAHIQDRISTPTHVRHGSVLDLEPSWFPPCECCFTSPPFMTQTMEENPFENYAGRSTYEEYLADIETAFTRLGSVLAPGGHVVVDVANMKHDGTVTPLAWDIADRVSNVFEFEGEVVVTWEGESPIGRDGRFGYGYDHTYCHVFRNSEP
ncbi:DNA methyltransferase [Halocatena salina]|uniref:Type II methyltransferase n=1 Tax=Halocatena salina TaxID=2934340 RepID=A0A8U0A1V7_9EURY|nr:DNA methyltransferase [Halocatena salina]UPM42438.1 site-specific DNA-methyltransferase [Halocatena salina]